MVLTLVVLLSAWLLPTLAGSVIAPFVEQWHYASTKGRERAEVEIARASLGEHPLEDISRAFADIAKAIGPSVVHIKTLQRVAGPRDEWSLLYGQRDFEAISQGSGVIIEADGYILTNNHVVSGAQEIAVKLSDGRTLSAQPIGLDPATDLAVLKIQAEGLIAAEWGDSVKLPVGSMVWAIGNPYGLDRSISFGIISAKGRQGVGSSQYQDYLQTDAVLNPGNSGGPLVDVNAKIIGINTAIIGPTYHGIGFAISSEMAKEVYQKLKSDGTVVRGWLGVALEDVTPETAKKLELKDTNGAIVKGVLPNSPADKAGIKADDCIVEWNKQPVVNSLALRMMVARTPIKSQANAVIIRDGEKMEVTVRVEERPAELDRRK